MLAQDLPKLCFVCQFQLFFMPGPALPTLAPRGRGVHLLPGPYPPASLSLAEPSVVLKIETRSVPSRSMTAALQRDLLSPCEKLVGYSQNVKIISAFDKPHADALARRMAPRIVWPRVMVFSLLTHSRELKRQADDLSEHGKYEAASVKYEALCAAWQCDNASVVFGADRLHEDPLCEAILVKIAEVSIDAVLSFAFLALRSGDVAKLHDACNMMGEIRNTSAWDASPDISRTQAMHAIIL